MYMVTENIAFQQAITHSAVAVRWCSSFQTCTYLRRVVSFSNVMRNTVPIHAPFRPKRIYNCMVYNVPYIDMLTYFMGFPLKRFRTQTDTPDGALSMSMMTVWFLRCAYEFIIQTCHVYM